MADVSIQAISQATARAPRSVVFVSEDVGYQFLIAASDVDFFYCKTTDGGATWGSPVEIDGDTTITCDWFDVWFDQWTPGDTGTKIHICWIDQGDDDPQYRSLDTNGDTLGTQTTIVAGTSTATGIGTQCSITKAVGGNLHFAGSIDNGTELFHRRSTDGGATWSAALAALRESGTGDWVHLLPAANTGDTQDVLAIYHDASANELTLKWYDQSADTVSESSAIVSINEDPNDQLGQFPFSASIRHSDGKLIVAAMTERDQSTGDHRVFELDRTSGAFAITELTAIATDIDDHFYPSVFIDQATDDIYIAYNGKRDGSETLRPVGSDDGVSKVYYTKSTDNGTTWSAGDTAYMEGAAASVVQTWAPLMGDRFYVVWRAAGIGGIATLFGNEVNSVTFGGASAIAGTAAQAFTNTGTLTGKGALAGTVQLAFTNAGELREHVEVGVLEGAVTLAFANAATLAGKGALAGAADQAFTNTAVLVGKGALAGEAAQAFTNSAALTADGALAGTVQLVFANTGSLTEAGSIGALAGEASVAFTTAATLTGRGALAGATAQVFANSATLAGRGVLAGISAPAFSNIAQLLGKGRLEGTAAMVFANTAEPSGGAPAEASGWTVFNHRRRRRR